MVEVQPPRFDVWIEGEEGQKIREALRQAGVAPDAAETFTGAAIHGLLEAWEQFVSTDWTRWDLAEYANDLSVRNTLEVLRASLGESSRRRLDTALVPLDQIFKGRMRPVESQGSGGRLLEPIRRLP
jgi:hypothetical protein